MRRTQLSSAIIAIFATVTAACAQNPPANTTATPPEATAARPPGMMSDQGMMGPGMMGPGMMGMGDQCPMLLPGASVQPQETADGMAMTFTTTGDMAELRRRVHVMADRMNARSSGASGGMGTHGMMMGADGGTGMMNGSMMDGMMPVHARVEDVDRGARLTVTPVDPAKLGEMRDHMKQHAQMMNQSHGCSMMVDGGR